MISLIDAAKYYRGLSHQNYALQYLQDNVPPGILDKFTDLWRQDQPELNEAGLTLVKQFEGLRLDAYVDAVGVTTIGYGTTVYPNGQKVKIGDRINIKEAEEFLKNDLKYFEGKILELVTVPLNDNQFSALVSFVYNVGDGAFRNSTMLRLLNKGMISQAAAEFDRWVYGGGKTLPGLQRRRKAERFLFNGQVDQALAVARG